mgnify:CR=1 FL=1
MTQDLILLTRLFDLLSWLLPKVEHFPKAYRQSITLRLMNLQDADAALNCLRLYLRLAHQWHWLNDGQYIHVSTQVAEIGKLLGGWIKQTRR